MRVAIYTAEFKAEADKQINERGRSIKAISCVAFPPTILRLSVSSF
jgi:hypothetical protein